MPTEQHKRQSGNTTIQIWADHIHMADTIGLHYATKAGRLMSRTEAMNHLIAREYAAIQAAKK